MPYYPERKPDPYAEEQKRIAEAAAKGKRRRLILAAAFSLLIIYSGIRLAAYGADYYASRQTSQTLYELYEEPSADGCSCDCGASAGNAGADSGTDGVRFPAAGSLSE